MTKTKQIFSVLFLFFALFSTQLSLAKNGNEKVVIGRVERVFFPKYDFSVLSRIDTGAHTSSLHITNPKISTEGGERFIEFVTDDGQGKKVQMKAKIEKEASIKGDAGESTKRYVIREKVKLGEVEKEILINLNDRSHMNYNFLVGRNFLRGNFLVDVALSHTRGD